MMMIFNVLKPISVYGGGVYAIIMIIVEMDQMKYIVMVRVLKFYQLSNQNTDSVN